MGGFLFFYYCIVLVSFVFVYCAGLAFEDLEGVMCPFFREGGLVAVIFSDS